MPNRLFRFIKNSLTFIIFFIKVSNILLITYLTYILNPYVKINFLLLSEKKIRTKPEHFLVSVKTLTNEIKMSCTPHKNLQIANKFKLVLLLFHCVFDFGFWVV